MINIIGGTYYENCRFPKWDEIFGSGLRACNALSKLSNEINFITCLTEEKHEMIAPLLDSIGVNLKEYYPIGEMLEFYYLHGLSAPYIRPSIDTLAKSTQTFEAKNILQYGMLEMEMIVSGDKVVYDPQAPSKPKHFLENGSTSNELALVLNRGEAISLSGEENIEKAGKKLLSDSSVVIIKDGGYGANVFFENSFKKVPAYKTDKVFSIGSGDIFSAVFAHFWIEENLDPYESAHLASKSTAYYCNSKSLPIHEKIIESQSFEAIVPREHSNKKKYDVYLAGPFFSLPEYWLVNDIRSCFSSAGVNVFSPIHEVGYGTSKDIAEADLKALNDSELVFAISDGLDSGTMFEVGYARSKNIPVIVYSSKSLGENATMLEGSDCEISMDLTTAIYKAIWKIIEG